MRISKIGASADSRTGFERRARADRRRPDRDQPQSRALVALQPQTEGRSFGVAQRPAAPFVAHLIAAHIQAPQTRARRRAELDDVIAAYSAMGPMQPVARCSTVRTI